MASERDYESNYEIDYESDYYSDSNSDSNIGVECDGSSERGSHGGDTSLEKPWNQKGASRGSTLEPMTMLKY